MLKKRLSPKIFKQGTTFFADGLLLCFTQGTIITRFESISDLNPEGFSGCSGNGLIWMTLFNVKVVDISLG